MGVMSVLTHHTREAVIMSTHTTPSPYGTPGTVEHRNGGAVDTYRAVLSPDGRTVRTYWPADDYWTTEHRPSVIRTFRPAEV